MVHNVEGWSGPGSALSFQVKGLPAPQGSKRYLGRSGGKGVMVESSSKVAPWRADVRAAAEQAMADHWQANELGGLPVEQWSLWRAPVLAEMIFYLPRARSHYGTGRNSDILKSTAPRWPATKPDLDKLIRAILDSLTHVVWSDDSQVVGIYTSKLYAHPGQGPGVKIHIKET